MGLINKFGILGELIRFLWMKKLWWMIPMVIIMVLFGLLLVFAQGSGLAPFIYTLFQDRFDGYIRHQELLQHVGAGLESKLQQKYSFLRAPRED